MIKLKRDWWTTLAKMIAQRLTALVDTIRENIVKWLVWAVAAFFAVLFVIMIAMVIVGLYPLLSGDYPDGTIHFKDGRVSSVENIQTNKAGYLCADFESGFSCYPMGDIVRWDFTP